ncbi:hypothetical protein CULT_510009 [[Clostridium] ultunense Esp]|nr:hypothetical protein CULT_510009 [[Clostridium] ultunense Esp]
MVWKIYLKELKDSFRDRKTLFLSVFVPVMMIAAMSFLYEYLFFNSAEKMESITVGISDKTDQAALEWLSTLEYVKFVRTNDPQGAAEAGDVQIAWWWMMRLCRSWSKACPPRSPSMRTKPA